MGAVLSGDVKKPAEAGLFANKMRNRAKGAEVVQSGGYRLIGESMKRLAVLAPLALVGCVTMSPQQMSHQSSWDVCRFTMGGPHSGVAEDERRRRGLDCSPYYRAIVAQQQAQNAAIANFLRATQPRPVTLSPFPTVCRTVRSGNGYNTVCD